MNWIHLLQKLRILKHLPVSQIQVKWTNRFHGAGCGGTDWAEQHSSEEGGGSLESWWGCTTRLDNWLPTVERGRDTALSALLLHYKYVKLQLSKNITYYPVLLPPQTAKMTCLEKIKRKQRWIWKKRRKCSTTEHPGRLSKELAWSVKVSQWVFPQCGFSRAFTIGIFPFIASTIQTSLIFSFVI